MDDREEKKLRNGALKAEREREREICKGKAKEFGRAKSESRRKIWDCVGVGGPKC